MTYTVIDSREQFLTGTAREVTNPTTGKYHEMSWKGMLPKLSKPPDAIVLHRTGNPDSSAAANRNFFYNTMRAVSHDIIQDRTVIVCIDPDRIGWHTNSATARDTAVAMGRSLTDPNLRDGKLERADVGCIGIEAVEVTMESGQPGFTSLTLQTLVERAADHAASYNIPVSSIYGHSEFDSVSRPEDPDGIITPDELRQLIQAELERRREAREHEIHPVSNTAVVINDIDTRLREVEGVIQRLQKALKIV